MWLVHWGTSSESLALALDHSAVLFALWIMIGATPCLPLHISSGPQQTLADRPSEATTWTNANVPLRRESSKRTMGLAIWVGVYADL